MGANRSCVDLVAFSFFSSLLVAPVDRASPSAASRGYSYVDCSRRVSDFEALLESQLATKHGVHQTVIRE